MRLRDQKMARKQHRMYQHPSNHADNTSLFGGAGMEQPEDYFERVSGIPRTSEVAYRTSDVAMLVSSA